MTIQSMTVQVMTIQSIITQEMTIKSRAIQNRSVKFNSMRVPREKKFDIRRERTQYYTNVHTYTQGEERVELNDSIHSC